MGCANVLCPRLSVAGGARYGNAHFVACIYGPHFFSSSRGNLFTESVTSCQGRDSRCTDADRQTCVEFQSGGGTESLEKVDLIGAHYNAGLYCGKLANWLCYNSCVGM